MDALTVLKVSHKLWATYTRSLHPNTPPELLSEEAYRGSDLKTLLIWGSVAIAAIETIQPEGN
jgi:hypothetical protein